MIHETNQNIVPCIYQNWWQCFLPWNSSVRQTYFFGSACMCGKTIWSIQAEKNPLHLKWINFIIQTRIATMNIFTISFFIYTIMVIFQTSMAATFWPLCVIWKHCMPIAAIIYFNITNSKLKLYHNPIHFYEINRSEMGCGISQMNSCVFSVS